MAPVLVLTPSSLAFPATAESLFGRSAPWVMEIGVGSGGFIEDLAQRRRDWNVLGVDRAPQSIARSYRRLREAELPHVRLFKGDAEWFTRNVVPPGGLRRIYVNFPDPWPRVKHRSRRLLQESFLRLVSSRLQQGGDLLVTTDHAEYFEFVLRNVSASGCFEAARTDPPAEVLATKWAGKASTHYHVVLRVNAPVDPDPPEIELIETMYHAVIEGDLPDLSSFEKLTFSHRGGVVVVMDAYRALRGEGYVFLVHIEELGLHQEVLVDVREGKQGYVVALRRFGEPLHTRGLRTAVRRLTEWLVEQGMHLIHKKY